MNGLFMINDPGFESGTQVISRFITYNGGSTFSNVRYVDILSNGDSVPSSITSTTASTARSAMTLGLAFSPELQRATAFYNIVSANAVKYSNDLGVTWTNGTMSTRQARGGLWVPQWQKMLGFGLTATGSPYTAQLFTSTDGITFQQQQTISGNVYTSYSAYSSGLDIAVFSNAGTATKNCCYWTKDGNTWYAGTFSGTSFNPGECPVIYQNYQNTFLVSRQGTSNANTFALSTDGKNWDPITATGYSVISGSSPLALAHNPITGRTIVGVFTGTTNTNLFYYSDNGGYNWTLRTVASGLYFIESARYDINTDMFIVSTRYGASSQQGFFLSSDGINWTFYAQANAGEIGIVFTSP